MCVCVCFLSFTCFNSLTTAHCFYVENKMVEFTSRSFHRYHVDFTTSQNAADLKLLFSPKKPDGTVVRVSDTAGSEYMGLQVS